jgi:hypothetical protein
VLTAAYYTRVISCSWKSNVQVRNSKFYHISTLTNSMAYGTRKFIAPVTNVRHWVISWTRTSQFSSRTPTSRRSLLILSSHRRLGHPKGLFPSGFPTTMEYIFTLKLKMCTRGVAVRRDINLQFQLKYHIKVTDYCLNYMIYINIFILLTPILCVRLSNDV